MVLLGCNMEVSDIDLQRLANLLLEKSGLNKTQLVNALGISYPTLLRWISGEVKTLQTDAKNKINKFLGERQLDFKLGDVYKSHVKIIHVHEGKIEYTSQSDNSKETELLRTIHKVVEENIELKEENKILKEELNKVKKK